VFVGCSELVCGGVRFSVGEGTGSRYSLGRVENGCGSCFERHGVQNNMALTILTDWGESLGVERKSFFARVVQNPTPPPKFSVLAKTRGSTVRASCLATYARLCNPSGLETTLLQNICASRCLRLTGYDFR
jgi:hypothetical protein